MGQTQVEKHPHLPAREILDRIVLGGSDGVIEGVAATSALNGAGVEFRTILVAGLAFAIAGGLSMFFSNYLSRKSELDSLRVDIERERMEIETEPDEERRELEDLLEKEGYTKDELGVIMNRLTRNKELWLREQLRHELHLHTDELKSNPVARSIPVGAAFFLLALPSLVPYLYNISRTDALLASAALSLAALFALGSKVYTLRHFSLKGGFESAAIGAMAACLLYGVGLLVGML